MDLCDLVCETRARTGDLTGAVDAARRRIQLQPLEEVGYRTLMRLQADLGDRAGAVSTYHHCASVLERELGVVPDPATRQAFQRLMAHADQAGAKLPTMPSPPPAAPGSPRHSSSAGRPSSACSRTCGGPPRRAAPVSRWSAAARASGRPAWWPRSPSWHGCKAQWWRVPSASEHRGGWRWRRWRTGCETRQSSQRRRRSTRPGAPRSTGWCRPGAAESAGPDSRAMVDAWQRHRFFEGLARALLAVGRPMLLVLDNMQWCDQETLAFLTFCLGLDPAAQLLVAGTAAQRQPRRRPRTRGLDGQDAGHRTAHRAFPQPAGGRRHGTSRRGDLRAAPP